jgi:ribonuclease HI
MPDKAPVRQSVVSPVRYRTIVADPPWHYGKAGGYSWRKGRPSGENRPMLAYETMTVEEIAALPVGEMAEDDAALFVWTTQHYLADTLAVIVPAWGFTPVKLLTWAKSPTGWSVGGTFGNATEFISYARRGKNIATERINRDWWNWPRRRPHSTKPEALFDIVEQTHPGPYAELFARRTRPGWDYPIGDGTPGGLVVPTEQEMLVLDLWTDGACSGAQNMGKGNGKGPGGWAAVLVDQSGAKLAISGSESVTTNNRMELRAVCEGLESVGAKAAVITIWTDSSYVKNAYTRAWVHTWRDNGWISSTGDPVANQDLWERLDNALAGHVVKWRHVKGHSTSDLNNLADRLAVEAKQTQTGVTKLL